MDLTQLECFYRIAIERSFTRAAAKLHISQPAVSTRLRKLEAELGSQLITRSSGPVELTEYGREFFPYVQRVFEVLDESASHLKSLQHRHSRPHVAVGVAPTCCQVALPQVVVSLVRVHGCRVTVRSGLADAVLGMVYDRIVDVGLIKLPPAFPTSLHRECLGSNRIIPVTDGSSPLSAISAVELTRLPIVGFLKTSIYWRAISEGFKASCGLELLPEVEVDSLEDVKQVLSGIPDAVAFLSEETVAAELAAGRLKVLAIEGASEIRHDDCMVYRPDARPARALTLFMEKMRSAYRGAGAGGAKRGAAPPPHA